MFLQDLGPSNYRGPQICAQFLSNYLTNKEAGILDVAAGTGRLGTEVIGGLHKPLYWIYEQWCIMAS